LRLDKKSATYLFVFGLIVVYITVYTVAAHSIARHAGEDDGKFYWRTTPAGSFFPWPREPGIFQALSEMHGIDVFIYVFLIRSWLLFGVTILLWIIFWVVFLHILRFKRSMKVLREKDSSQNI